jgi:hypothetical protein
MKIIQKLKDNWNKNKTWQNMTDTELENDIKTNKYLLYGFLAMTGVITLIITARIAIMNAELTAKDVLIMGFLALASTVQLIDVALAKIEKRIREVTGWSLTQ